MIDLLADLFQAHVWWPVVVVLLGLSFAIGDSVGRVSERQRARDRDSRASAQRSGTHPAGRASRHSDRIEALSDALSASGDAGFSISVADIRPWRAHVDRITDPGGVPFDGWVWDQAPLCEKPVTVSGPLGMVEVSCLGHLGHEGACS